MTLAYDMERLAHLLRHVKKLSNDILVRHGEVQAFERDVWPVPPAPAREE